MQTHAGPQQANWGSRHASQPRYVSSSSRGSRRDTSRAPGMFFFLFFLFTLLMVIYTHDSSHQHLLPASTSPKPVLDLLGLVYAPSRASQQQIPTQAHDIHFAAAAAGGGRGARDVSCLEPQVCFFFPFFSFTLLMFIYTHVSTYRDSFTPPAMHLSNEFQHRPTTST